MKPSIGRIVHYVSFGTPGGEYGKECRAAVITEVQDDPQASVGLAVLNPTGMFFSRAVPHGDGASHTMPHPGATRTALGDPVLCDGKCYQGGTWHWPGRVAE